MFHIIQSNDTDRLVNHLIDFYKKNDEQDDLAHLIFTPFTVIVPSMVLGDWLTKTVASRVGISTLFTAEFWGRYQWEMIKTVLGLDAQANPADALFVPEVAVLSASIMRWRIFGFVMDEFHKHSSLILSDDAHPLHFLVKPLYDDTQGLPEHRLWQACDELSRLYVRYLTHRPEWLMAWSEGVSLAQMVSEMMDEKQRLDEVFGATSFKMTSESQADNANDDNDSQNEENNIKGESDEEGSTPAWLRQHYLDLERLLGYLWSGLFGETYRYRLALEERFWQVLSGKKDAKGDNHEDKLSTQAICALPKALYLFTVQQIPKAELEFLKQLSLYLDVVLLHFNPSMMFWADIVDRQWLKTQQIIRPHMVYLKDYGHGLLSRLGKESRDTFAMLADLSGGEHHQRWQVRWQDDFHEAANGTKQALPNLLQGLKSDILMLHQEHDSKKQAGGQILTTLLDEIWNDTQFDDEQLAQKSRPKTPLTLDMGADMSSLSIHACHSLKRQLEIARLMIAKYLNDNPKRSLADVVVLLPDIVSSEDIIRSVFPVGRGVDGLNLPIKITGTPDRSIDELMRAIMGFYVLLGEPSSRFGAEDVYEWLLIPALYESFGLSFEEMKRGIDLLRQAGFRRGFDERHLSETLHVDDSDYRYTFSHALDRLVLGLLAPAKNPSHALYPFAWHQGVFTEASLPLMGVSLSDEPIIDALTIIHVGLSANRHLLTKVDSVERLLNHIEDDVITPYFGRLYDSVAMRAIFKTKNTMMSSLRANKYYHRHLSVGQQSVTHAIQGGDIYLSMKFVLESLTEAVKAQAISAEPSEVITFARFGALRSIPFGLTVMLDMNLSAFPRQDRAVRLDLMRAGIRQLGDRYNEDDDNGAFLDALLCTRDACLIFYQGLSADGHTKLLPASVVGELIEFFKTEAQWSQDNLGKDWQEQHEAGEISTLIAQLMPALIEDYLITYHDATFFDKSVYYQDEKPHTSSDDLVEQLKAYLGGRLFALKQRQKQALPPPLLWQQIRQTLDAPKTKPQSSSTLINQHEIIALAQLLLQSLDCHDDETLSHHVQKICRLYELTLPTSIHGDELIYRVKNFAKTYLKGKAKMQESDTLHEQNEPLALDALGHYRMNELFIGAASLGLFDGLHETVTSLDVPLLSVLDDMTNQDSIQAKHDIIGAMQALYYGDLLPAGQLRLSTPDEYFTYFRGRASEFMSVLEGLKQNSTYEALGAEILSNGHYLTPTTDQHMTLCSADIEVGITANLPDDTRKVWLNILPNAARAEHLFRFFVKHLLWQATSNQNKLSIWQFDKASEEVGFTGKIFAVVGISQFTAKAYLLNLIMLSDIAQKTPIIMTHRDGFNHIRQQSKEGFKLNPKLFEHWMGSAYEMIYDNDSRHESWQLLLQGSDPYQALVAYLPLATPLYQLMNQHLISIDVTAKTIAKEKRDNT